jgi:hypothetical protein
VRLADATLAALPKIETNAELRLGTLGAQLFLPLKKLPTGDQAAAALAATEERLAQLIAGNSAEDEINRAKSERLYASITHFYAKETGTLNGHLPVELQGLRIGDAVIVAVPAEVFVEIGLQIKQRAARRTFIAGIANGYIGYLTTGEAHAIGGYEVVSSKCAPEAEGVLIEKTLALSRKLFTGGRGDQ